MMSTRDRQQSAIATLFWCWLLPAWYVGLAASGYMAVRNGLLRPPWSEVVGLAFVMTTASFLQALFVGTIAVIVVGAAEVWWARRRKDESELRLQAAVAVTTFVTWIGFAPLHGSGAASPLRSIAPLAALVGLACGALTLRIFRHLGGRSSTALWLRHGGRATAVGMFAGWLVLGLMFAARQARLQPESEAESQVSRSVTVAALDRPLRFPPLDPPLQRGEGRGPVVLLGIDGLSWRLLESLIADGSAPHFAALRERGAWAELGTLQPTWSPRIWTTVATGRKAADHGILGFVTTQYPALGIHRLVYARLMTLNQPLLDRVAQRRRIPISSQERRVKAIWNLASEAGILVGVVGWWASWPAEPVNGYMVTDHAYYDLLEDKQARRVISEIPGRFETYPERLGEELAALRPFEGTLERQSGAIIRSEDERRSLDRRRTVSLAVEKDRFFAEAALHLLEEYHPDLAMLYLNAVDTFGHTCSAEALERGLVQKSEAYDAAGFSRCMRGAIRGIDQWLGRLVERLDENTTLIVVSDHGFEPQDPERGLGPFGHDEAPAGLFVATGPHVRTAVHIANVGIQDVAPTLFYLVGLPLSEELDGRLLGEAIDPELLSRYPPRWIPTYETGAPRRLTEESSAADEEVLKNLRALGYVD